MLEQKMAEKMADYLRRNGWKVKRRRSAKLSLMKRAGLRVMGATSGAWFGLLCPPDNLRALTDSDHFWSLIINGTEAEANDEDEEVGYWDTTGPYRRWRAHPRGTDFEEAPDCPNALWLAELVEKNSESMAAFLAGAEKCPHGLITISDSEGAILEDDILLTSFSSLLLRMDRHAQASKNHTEFDWTISEVASESTLDIASGNVKWVRKDRNLFSLAEIVEMNEPSMAKYNGKIRRLNSRLAARVELFHGCEVTHAGPGTRVATYDPRDVPSFVELLRSAQRTDPPGDMRWAMMQGEVLLEEGIIMWPPRAKEKVSDV